MSGQIRVSPETLQSRAREYGKAANDIRVILSNLQRLQDTLRSEWEGAAFQGFDQQFFELIRLLKRCNKMTKIYLETLVFNNLKLRLRRNPQLFYYI